ncbi:MAG: hypothetical protein E7070_08575 [Bacteroidales bacterium]|jgi:hypothetical protein|nr:hypothetical protein [Bacteroidales bacterium]
MNYSEIYNAAQLTERIQEIGFLPLLPSAIAGFSAEEMVADDCRYVTFPDGGWDWPLWKWKGPVVTDGNCVYGKFFDKKAGFISREWWPDFCNYRRSRYPAPAEGSIEEAILLTLREHGSLVTRQLRAACDFTGHGMRSRFDGYVTRLEMACYVITEDFVYPTDRHGQPYGWGLSLLTTPEKLFGHDDGQCSRSPEESFQLLFDHFRQILPDASEAQIRKIIG